MRALRTLGVLALAAWPLGTSMGAAPQAANSQVAYYAYEEASGLPAADSSGNNFNGSRTASVQFSAVGDCAPVPFGNQRSAVLPLSAATGGNSGYLGTGAYISTPDAAGMNFTGPFSTSVWIKPAAFNTGQNPNNRGAILFNWNWLDPPGVFNGYGVDRLHDGRINFYTGTTTVMETLTSAGTAPLDTWTHVACVYTGSEKRIYINAGTPTTVASTLNPGASTAPFQVGKDDWWRNFYGNVDEVRLFNYALSDAEVSVLHAGVGVPQNVNAFGVVDGITVTWTAVSGATSYTIERGPAANGPWTGLGTATGTSYTDSGALFPSTFFYRVIAVGPFGMSGAPSAAASASSLSPIPRTNDHDEGFLDDRCECGSTVGSEPGWGMLLAVAALLLTIRRR